MADDEPTTETVPETPAQGETPKGEDDLAGLRSALEKERADRKAYEKDAKRARSLEAELAKIREADQSETEKATSRADAAEKRAQGLIDRTVRAEVKAEAASGFKDPDDAAVFLDLSAYVGEDGEIDNQQIKTDLADLLKRKPHLAKEPDRKGPKPDPSQGAKPGGTPDLAARIREAEKAGNHRQAIALKRQQAALTQK
ncbi:hypothetical protein AB0L53_54670 [Nonomuraea sp. NPDC052129]|uniref:hypothetical protein n=1 Tax=Nonomuraea sp. NPDC052129 TaxID=3154651 RepID=UPI0034475240